MSERRCLLCGGSLPPVPLWKKILMLDGMPRHDAAGPDALACWRGLNKRMGTNPDRPMPKARLT